jgi:hypothetical protein
MRQRQRAVYVLEQGSDIRGGRVCLRKVPEAPVQLYLRIILFRPDDVKEAAAPFAGG